jgi:hypothetical protein
LALGFSRRRGYNRPELSGKGAMQALLIGLLLLVAILIAGRFYVNADAATMARLMRRIGGVVVLSAALGLFVTGRILLALPLAGLGLWLLGKRMPWMPRDDVWSSTGKVTSVRTVMLEMTLDHGTGTTDGRVLSGQFGGRALSQLSRDELSQLLQECLQRDAQGAQLLRAYIERLGFSQDQASGGGGAAGRRPNGMTVAEAYDVLGLAPGASVEDIHQAHRTLMKRNHPDQGGSTYLASKINEAKDVLLRQI